MLHLDRGPEIGDLGHVENLKSENFHQLRQPSQLLTLTTKTCMTPYISSFVTAMLLSSFEGIKPSPDLFQRMNQLQSNSEKPSADFFLYPDEPHQFFALALDAS